MSDDLLAEVRRLQSLMKRGKHYSFSQGIWQQIGDALEAARATIAEREQQIAAERVSVVAMSRAFFDKNEQVAALEAALREARNALADYAVPAPAPRADKSAPPPKPEEPAC